MVADIIVSDVMSSDVMVSNVMVSNVMVSNVMVSNVMVADLIVAQGDVPGMARQRKSGAYRVLFPQDSGPVVYATSRTRYTRRPNVNQRVRERTTGGGGINRCTVSTGGPYQRMGSADRAGSVGEKR